ncbi:MAG: DNA repair protein RecO [Pseudomonadota bacterium]
MANWSDTALILGGRRFGEGGLILDVLTATRGRRAGLVYGGASRRRRGQLEAGNTVELTWQGRLEEQLGRFEVAEAITERAADHLDRPQALAAIGALTAILRDALEEGDVAGSSVYEATVLVLDLLEEDTVWPALYVRWEMGLLAALGFGLDLTKCALSGANDGLTHVSPRTGRAVKGSEAEEYLDRLFELPPFLIDASAPASPAAVGQGLHLTGYFLERRLYNLINRPPPEARDLLLRRLERAALASVPD